MPGLHFVCDFNGDLKQKETQLLSALRSLVHSELYTYKVIEHERTYFFGLSKYEEYPFTTLQNDRYSIIIEGEIYGKDPSLLHGELRELADRIFHKGTDVNKILSDWLLNTDGDFVIVILDKSSGRIIIFNDILGRLPLYFYQESHCIYISREIRFITNLVSHIRLDQMAIAQYLLFGYPLASRTLFEYVHRLQPATIIDIDLHQPKIKVEVVYTFNFDEKAHKEQKKKENIGNLHALFLDATKNRAISVGKNIVGLSGGLDSRAVASALRKLNIPFSGATYLDFNKRAIHDVRIAEQLARTLGIDWKLFHLDLPNESDALELLEIKGGMNFLGMSYILNFFKSVKQSYGNRIVLFTGDGGDKTLPDLRPNRSISNVNELLDFILKSNQIFSIDEVSSLTNLERHQIMSEIKDIIMAYPEREWQNKYIHFLLFERGFKWLFEGEDRNRFYFWSVTPFYSLPFFIYAMNCPESIKRRYKFYQGFLVELSPEASSVPSSNWQFPITSDFRLFLITSIYPKLPFEFRGLIRKLLNKPNITKPVAENWLFRLEEQANRCSRINEHLSVSELRNLGNINQNEFDILYTVTSVIENSECKQS